VRLSTKDQLKQLGINVNMSFSDGGNSLLGSDDLNPVDNEELDQFNIDYLESEDEDLLE
jgi:hypothetical protein